VKIALGKKETNYQQERVDQKLKVKEHYWNGTEMESGNRNY